MKLIGILLLGVCAGLEAQEVHTYRWETGGLRSFGRDDQIEVGGPLAGLEFHGSRPVPSRISLYAPVANSIDLSSDYWKRGESQPLDLIVRVDDGPEFSLGKEPCDYLVAPHRVVFEKSMDEIHLTITYECGVRAVAATLTIDVKNAGNVRHAIAIRTALAFVLRSCQSYHRIMASKVRFDKTHRAILAEFDDPRLARPTLFLQDVSAAHGQWSTGFMSVDGVDTSRCPVGAFGHAFDLDPGAALCITMVLGSSTEKENARAIRASASGWQHEVQEYASRIKDAAYRGGRFQSGDAWTDSAVSFSRALLAANQHHLNGTVVPMPCPAEYNFFFTHDVLLTDLSAIMFDPDRVKRDLLYLQSLARNNDLPHAYYWKDDGFKTEYSDAGNWNNLWVILAAATYYRHTFDDAALNRLYPLLTRAIEKTLTMQKGSVMHGREPDWWDFGAAPGARAYLTILTVRALEEFVYLSASIQRGLGHLAAYEGTAAALRKGLASELWDGSRGYLLNTTPAGKDGHIYMGPLLAAVYGILPAGSAGTLVETARTELLDPAVGIRTVSPADFHTDSVKAFYGVKSNEAGNQYLYANGGIWYLGNAWYAWARRAVGDIEGGFGFYRRTMTLDGILQSPRGQPALYEYRYADTSSVDHGRVDKPAMMWSAGFCIGSAYRLAGIRDEVWNVVVGDAAPGPLQEVRAPFAFGNIRSISRKGKGAMLTRLAVDGRAIPSRILPRDAASGTSLDVEMGPILYPFLDSTNAVLRSAKLEVSKRTMRIVLSSFRGHLTTAKIITPWLARSVAVNGRNWRRWEVTSTPLGTLVILVHFDASATTDTVELNF